MPASQTAAAAADSSAEGRRNREERDARGSSWGPSICVDNNEGGLTSLRGVPSGDLAAGTGPPLASTSSARSTSSSKGPSPKAPPKPYLRTHPRDSPARWRAKQ